MVPARVRYRLRAYVAAAIATVLAVLLTGGPAHADPNVGAVEAELAKAWNEAEPLIEQYNAVHEKYQKNKARQQQLQKQIAPLALEVELTQIKVGAMAAQAYRGGRVDPLTALMTSGSPRAFVDQLSYIDAIAHEQANQIADVRNAKESYDKQKAPIDDLVRELAEQDADLATRKKAIEAKLADLQKLRVKAYGSSTGGIGTYRPWTCPSEYLPTKGYKAANFACKQAGKPYVWGAAGPSSYDCSGLTLDAWRQVGVYLPHNANEQSHSMRLVSRANIQIGDLVFYYTPVHHVTIYVGNGKVMSAPTFGDVVRMQPMDYAGPIHSIGRPG